MSRREPVADPTLLIATAVTAVVGGVLAVLVLGAFGIHTPIPFGEVLLVIVAAALCVAAVVPLSGAGRSPTPAAAVRRPVADGGWRPDPPNPPAPPPPVAPRPAAPPPAVTASPLREPVSIALPVAGESWWDAAASAQPAGAAPTPAGERPGGPAADLSSYTATSRVAQCPNCGDFGIDVRRHASGFDLSCTRCAHRWTWGPGRPWPPTMVRPRLGRGPSRG